MSSNNINPEVIQMLDQLAQWRSAQMGGYTPQAQQLYGNPRAVQAMQQAGQYGITLAPYANSLMNPSALIGGLGTLGTYGVLEGARQATPQDWQNAMQTARFGIPVNQQYTRRRY